VSQIASRALLSMSDFCLRLMNPFARDLCNDENLVVSSSVKCLCYVHDLLVVRSNARALH
jgi:hypothetical protein